MLGAVFVFLFFGIVAVAGSFFVQVEHLNWEAFALAVPVGLLAAAILVVNNIRDIDTDRRAGKRTLAVRLGRERTRTLYALMLALAFAALALRLIGVIRTRTDGPSLNVALARTGALQLLFCLLYSAGIL